VKYSEGDLAEIFLLESAVRKQKLHNEFILSCVTSLFFKYALGNTSRIPTSSLPYNARVSWNLIIYCVKRIAMNGYDQILIVHHVDQRRREIPPSIAGH